jgi:putative transposase
MDTSARTNPYAHYRFPAEIISHGVWLCFRFCLSYRDVEQLLCARGVIVTYDKPRQNYLSTNGELTRPYWYKSAR